MPSIMASAFDYFRPPLPVRTVEKTRFRFHTKSGRIEWEGGAGSDEYRLIVDGIVRAPVSLSYADLLALPRIQQVSDLHCVEGWGVKDLAWGGFRFREILDRVQPVPEATHVLFHALGKTESAPKGQTHYIECLPLAELLDPSREILLTLTLAGRPLPEKHGGPLRLIAPYDLGYKSIKFVCRIEFIRSARPGWWTLANPVYPVEARVPEKRLRRLPKKQ